MRTAALLLLLLPSMAFADLVDLSERRAGRPSSWVVRAEGGSAFAPYGFAYHQAHHTYLTVPFYNLPRLANLLETRDEQYFRRVKGSYVLILAKMIWARK